MFNSQDLRFLYWNADGVNKKQCELADLVSSLAVDIIAICETRLTNRLKLNIPGYVCYRNDKHQNGIGQGVAILVKSDVDHSLVGSPKTKYTESIGIKLNINNFKCTIYSIYQSPNLPLLTSDIDLLLESDNQVLLMGDFNAKHKHWFPGVVNSFGNILFNHMLNRDYSIYAPSSPTLVHYRPNHTQSLPDLVVSNNIYNIDDSSFITIAALSSNHLPVFFRIMVTFERKSTTRFNFAKANWNLYRSSLNNNIHLSSAVFKSPEEIDGAIANLTDNITLAADTAIPLVSASISPKRLPRKIRRLISSKNRLRKLDQHETNSETRKQLRTQINFLNKHIHSHIIQHNDKIWSDKLKKVNNPGPDLWRLAKNIKASSFAVIPPLLRTDGSKTSSPLEQCEELASAFHKNLILTHDWQSTEVEADVMASSSLLANFQPGTLVNPVFPRELANFIRRLKLRKAPGLDKIANCLLKSLPQKAVVLITKIFNSCLSLAYFPSAWKVAKVIAIKKPGKDGTIPISYRPISLLPSLAKLFEKIINSRLLMHTKHLLINEQFGFRNAHSTVQQLARVSESIAHNMNLGHSTGMFLLDIEKAFDTVWHKGLIHKLVLCKVPMHLIKMIHSYLSFRSFYVHIGDVSSTSHPIPAGVPQGSIIGPYLFLLYINDIPKQTRTSLACFADDTACLTSSKDVDLVIDRLQLAIEGLSKFFTTWKLKLNSTKTEAILFTRARQMPTRNLSIDDHIIPWNKTVKYLGLILESKLSWNDHILHLRTKGMNAFKALSPLLNRRSTLSSSTKMRMYSTLIRPCITYACPVWSNTTITNINKLQVIQNRALKNSFNTPFCTNLINLHKQINFPRLIDFIIRLTKNFYSITNPDHPNDLISNIGTTRPMKSNYRYRYVTKLPHHYLLHHDGRAGT